MAQEASLDRVLQILNQSLSKYRPILTELLPTISVIRNEIKTTYPETEDKVADFYMLVGCNAVIADIKVLSDKQMKNSLGFAELKNLLKSVFSNSEAKNLVPTIDSSSSVFNTIYSDTSISAFGGSWSTHVKDDIRSIARMIDSNLTPDESQAEKNLKKYYEEMGDEALFKYDVMVNNVLSFLRDEYESTYQLVKPKGIIVPAPDKPNPNSLLSIRGTDGQVTRSNSYFELFQTISEVVNSTFRVSDDVQIDLDHDFFSAEAVANTTKRIFFVRPHIKLLFGRNLFSKAGENFTHPLGVRKHSTWSSAEDQLKKFVETSYRNMVIYYFRLKGKQFYDIDSKNSMTDACQDPDNFSYVTNLNADVIDAFEKLTKSIITTYIVSEFGGTKDRPSKIAIRGTFPENSVDSETLFTDIAQKSNKRLTEDAKVKFVPRKQLVRVPLNNLVVYQYDHVFNNASANAVPLFAAKALEYIENTIRAQQLKNPNLEPKGISWENLLVGMTKDGIIEQGQEHVQLLKNIVHWMSATSRAGKGVASYNIIIPMLSENRLFFYNDRKPDTSVVLAQQAGMKDGVPQIALVNGGQDNAIGNEDDRKYISWEEKNFNNHCPQWLDVKSSNDRADFVYLRQAMVVLALLDTITRKGLQQTNIALGLPADYVTGISAVFDEFTNYQKAFLSRLDPFARSNPLVNDMLSEDVYDLIQDPDSKAYKDIKNKGLMKKINMSNAWKLTVMRALTTATSKMFELGNAGLVTSSNMVDILVIGQGIWGYDAKSDFDLPTNGSATYRFAKNGILGNLDAADSTTADSLTSILRRIPNQDFILGTPPTGFDMLDVAGANNDVYGAYLNKSFRGFAYINNVDRKANPRSGFIFKPFLLLNEGTELPEMKRMAKEGKLKKEELNQIVEKNKNKKGGYLAYLASEVDNINGTSWLEVRKELVDTLHLNEQGESLAGVIPYSKKIGFSPDKYHRTIEFMNRVVQKMGYRGTYHDFVCDLRPEWIIGVPDITTAIFDGEEAFQNRQTLDPIRKYVKSSQFDSTKESINQSLIGLGADVDDIFDEDEDYHDDEPMYEEPKEPITDRTNMRPDENTGDKTDSFGSIYDHLNNPPKGFNEIGAKPDEVRPQNEEPVRGSHFKEDGAEQKVQPYEPIDDFPVDDDIEIDTPFEEEEQARKSRGTTNQEPEEPEEPEEPQQPEQHTQSEEPEPKHAQTEPVETNSDEQFTDEQQEYRYLGVKDAHDGHLAYTSSKKIALQATGMLDAYNYGYKSGYADSPKRYRIESLCSTNLPEARETAELLDIKPNSDNPSNNITNSTNRPVGKRFLDNNDLFDSPIYRKLPINVINILNKLSSGDYTEEAFQGYGLDDNYVANGKVGNITSMDVAITAPYVEKMSSETGKVDVDKTLTDYIQLVTEQIINKVGSYGQFHKIVVTDSGQMVVNDMIRLSFALPASEYQKLPLGIKMIVDQQQWGKLFSWQELKQMKNLTLLSIDSYEFLYSYVKPYYKSDSLADGVTVLRWLPQLVGVCLAGNTTTRDEVPEMSAVEKFKFNWKNGNFKHKQFVDFNKNREKLNQKYNEISDRIYKKLEPTAKGKHDFDYANYISEAKTRRERIRREKEERLSNSSNVIKNSLRKKDFRSVVSETGFLLRVIPGVLIARRRQRTAY